MSERSASLPQLARRVWRLLDPAQKCECGYALLVSIAAECFTVGDTRLAAARTSA